MQTLTNDGLAVHRLGGRGFTFAGARIENLGATEYTLVTIAVDESGSVAGFAKELLAMLVAAVEACKRSPRSDNLLLRALTFSSMHDKGTNEIHGFKPLAEIDPALYPELNPGGATPLCDACYSSIGAMNAYGQNLRDSEFGVNAIAFVITDGAENASTATMKMVKEEVARGVQGETLESMVSVLVGINAGASASALDTFKNAAGFSHFIDAGNATKEQLAKLAGFISQSVSSQSQALGTGGPSKTISAAI